MTDDVKNLGLAGRLTRSFITSPLTPLFLLASLAMGMIALVSLPREEEPQISVPIVDIFIRADGLKAEDAVKLITEPLEQIIQSIDQIDHVYSSTRDNQVLLAARFLVGVDSEPRSCGYMTKSAPISTSCRWASRNPWWWGGASTMWPLSP